MSEGLRERKRARTRADLARVALELFGRKGFEATSVEEIAAAAEVSPRTFFRYFPAKEEVVFPRETERLARFRRGLRNGGASPWDAVRGALLGLARELRAERDQAVAEERAAAASPALQARERLHDRRWEEAIARALGRGFRGRVWAAAIVGAMRCVVRDWAARGGKGDLERIGTEAFEWLERGAKGGTR